MSAYPKVPRILAPRMPVSFIRVVFQNAKRRLHYVTGTPVYFVSHAWRAKIKDLLLLLRIHFRVKSPQDENARVLLWLDIMVSASLKAGTFRVQNCSHKALDWGWPARSLEFMAGNNKWRGTGQNAAEHLHTCTYPLCTEWKYKVIAALA